MTIGLDLSVIQTPHRMRGIGATAINFVNNIPTSAKSTHKFILYLYEKDQKDALAILNLADLNYEVRELIEPKRINLRLPVRLRIINSLLNALRELAIYQTGDPRVHDVSGLNAFLQFDPMQALPKSRKLKRGLVLYDLIPYVMEPDYLWSYKTARMHQNSRKTALRKALRRRQYIVKARSVSRSADELFAISHHTKDDYGKYARIPAAKIKVVYLGIDPRHVKRKPTNVPFKHYISNSWGYFPKKIDLSNKPFLLFVGGADPRRKLNHLVTAYNNLRARGYDIRLVLAGDTMKGPYAIPVIEVQKYIAESSYLDNIAFLGFVTDEQREWLYAHAVAMVYPSVYEGFGLPVLEAMQYGTPVITYKNTSIHEIAGDAVLYANDALSIMHYTEQLLTDAALRSKCQQLGRQQAAKFGWDRTAQKIIDILLT